MHVFANMHMFTGFPPKDRLNPNLVTTGGHHGMSRALVLGGVNDAGFGAATNAPNNMAYATTVIEAFNPFTRTWSVAGNMLTLRWQHVSVVLANGQVLTTGG